MTAWEFLPNPEKTDQMERRRFSSPPQCSEDFKPKFSQEKFCCR
jgi:hypothetical protein